MEMGKVHLDEVADDVLAGEVLAAEEVGVAEGAKWDPRVDFHQHVVVHRVGDAELIAPPAAVASGHELRWKASQPRDFSAAMELHPGVGRGSGDASRSVPLADGPLRLAAPRVVSIAIPRSHLIEGGVGGGSDGERVRRLVGEERAHGSDQRRHRVGLARPGRAAAGRVRHALAAAPHADGRLGGGIGSHVVGQPIHGHVGTGRVPMGRQCRPEVPCGGCDVGGGGRSGSGSGSGSGDGGGCHGDSPWRRGGGCGRTLGAGGARVLPGARLPALPARAIARHVPARAVVARLAARARGVRVGAGDTRAAERARTWRRVAGGVAQLVSLQGISAAPSAHLVNPIHRLPG